MSVCISFSKTTTDSRELHVWVYFCLPLLTFTLPSTLPLASTDGQAKCVFGGCGGVIFLCTSIPLLRIVHLICTATSSSVGSEMHRMGRHELMSG